MKLGQKCGANVKGNFEPLTLNTMCVWPFFARNCHMTIKSETKTLARRLKTRLLQLQLRPHTIYLVFASRDAIIQFNFMAILQSITSNLRRLAVICSMNSNSSPHL